MVARRKQPSRVRRGSRCAAITGPELSAFAFIVRNFSIGNGVPLRLQRSWRYSTGPRLVSLIAAAMTAISGDNKRIAISDNSVSIARLTTTLTPW